MAPTAQNTAKTYVSKTMQSPVGMLTLVGSDDGLAAVLWENEKPNRVRLHIIKEDVTHPVLLNAEKQLQEYFAGKRTTFDLQLDFAGTTFQKKVWQALLTIPFGETRSYGQIAHQIQHIKAVRAVGAANGKNPISIIAPCHRVIGASGKMVGFAGGMKAKAVLLELEGMKMSDEPHANTRVFAAT